MSNRTLERKDDHLRVVLEEDVSFGRVSTNFEAYRFTHQALPEIHLEDIDLSTSFLGKSLAYPLIIASMTGGTPRGAQINRILAEAAQEMGIGMGLGSLRAGLEDPQALASFQMRRYAPDVLLLANLGAVQLNYGYGAEICRRAVEEVEADGLILHLNPLQEALQPEGQTRFGGLLGQIETLCTALDVPVVVKEVGWGLSGEVARRLIDAGVAALDVAGAGGTSWSQVELHRNDNPRERAIAAAFREWGIPTAESLCRVRDVDPYIPLVASGGLRSGVEMAKALALGANATSMAKPLLEAANVSVEALRDRLTILRRELQITMFVVGAENIEALQRTPLMHTGKG